MKKKVKLSDFVNEIVDVEQLFEVRGGLTAELQDGCQTGICSQRINPDYCKGGAVCTSGIAGPIKDVSR